MTRNLMVILVLLVCGTFSCKPKSKDFHSMNEPGRPIAEIKEDVLSKGDLVAYGELTIIYLNYPPEDFLFWSLVMANKYNFGNAYLDVFFCLKDSFNPDSGNYSLSNMDNKTKEMAIKYLQQAVKMNVVQAASVWEGVKNSNDLKDLGNDVKDYN